MSIEAEPRALVGSPKRAWRYAMLAPLFSLLVTQPWVAHPFPVWDYAEMLPLLRRSHGLLGAFQALASFYRAQGRANYLTYAQIALTWGTAGAHPVGWQLQRALFMLAAALLLVVVARRLGATPLAAAVGALVFVLAVPSTEGWLLLMGEPLALCLLLLLVLAAAGFRTTPAWRSRALLIALLAAALLLCKEVLGVLLPAVLLFAVSWVPGEGFRRPALGPRERRLALLLLGVLALEVWSVRAALHDAAPQSYAAAYGAGGVGIGRIGTLVQAMLLPARFVSAGAATDLYPANLAFVLLLILGLAQPKEGASRSKGWGWWAAGLLSYPLVGALVYAPWPRYSAFYGIPFFAGSVGLLIAAAGAVERAHRIGRWLAGILGGLTVLYCALVAERVIAEKHALSGLAVEIAQALPRAPRLDTLFVVSPSRGGRRWPVNARELSHYAAAIGVAESALPAMLDVSCETVARRLSQPLGRNAVLNDQNPCGRLPVRSAQWQAEVRYRDWLSLGSRRDTVRVELLAPSWGVEGAPARTPDPP